jgi:hypothetical protein
VQALGATVFGIGIWAVVQDETDFESNVASGGVILITAGIVTMIICVVGIIGAIFKLRPLLVLVSPLPSP